MCDYFCCKHFAYTHTQKAVERGAVVKREPWEESDEHGTATFATIQTVRPMMS